MKDNAKPTPEPKDSEKLFGEMCVSFGDAVSKALAASDAETLKGAINFLQDAVGYLEDDGKDEGNAPTGLDEDDMKPTKWDDEIKITLVLKVKPKGDTFEMADLIKCCSVNSVGASKEVESIRKVLSAYTCNSIRAFACSLKEKDEAALDLYKELEEEFAD